jgi:hypothetical protein
MFASIKTIRIFVDVNIKTKDMKVLTGHLTRANKKAIKAIIEAGLVCGKVGKSNYHLSLTGNIYTVKETTKDRGLVPVIGSSLRISTYISTFTL